MNHWWQDETVTYESEGGELITVHRNQEVATYEPDPSGHIIIRNEMVVSRVTRTPVP